MKKLLCFYLTLLFTCSAIAQVPSKVAKYDLPKKRLLLQLCSTYLYNSNQGAIDVDSSVVLAATAYKLPLLLAYNEGFDEKSTGIDLTVKGNIDKVKKLLTTTKGEDRIKILLDLGSFYLFKPGVNPADLQNAKTYIDHAVSESYALKIVKLQHQSLLLFGKYYFQANNQPESKKCFSIVINECRKSNDKLGLAQSLEAQADVLSNLDPEKEKLLNEVMTLYATLGLEEKRIENFSKITTIYFWSGRMKEAKKRLYQNLIDLRKIGFAHQQFGETTITFLEVEHHNMKSALYYALKSVKRMEREKDYTFAEIFYMRLGDVYNLYGHNKEALQLYEKSIEIGKNNINSGRWFKGFFGAVAALALKGQTKEALVYINSMTAKYPPKNTFDKMSVAFIKASCYDALDKNIEAEKYFKEMDFYAKQLNAPETTREIAHQYTIMALFYIKTNRPGIAQIYTDKVLAYYLKGNNVVSNSENLKMLLYKTDSIKGNYKEALIHFQDYKKISDSVHGIAKNQQIEELKIEYETKNKEEKISLLSNQSKLQKSELQKSKLLNNVSIGSLILLLIIIGLLFNRYRLKQKNHAKLEIKEREIHQKNINLRHLLDEKEWLLKEVHHRVKNNLQTVISLLSSQAAYLNNDMALSAIKNSQHRIHSMSLIHQKLYKSDNIATINMPIYITDLVEYLKESFSIGQRIRFEIRVAELELDVAQAIPLGLILNEAITNSIKYAFPDNGIGIIEVALEKTETDRYLLVISDNGIGIDINLNDDTSDSFGMSLIKGLSDDLEAKFLIENNNGTVLKLEFKPEHPLNKKYVKKPDLNSED